MNIAKFLTTAFVQNTSGGGYFWILVVDFLLVLVLRTNVFTTLSGINGGAFFRKYLTAKSCELFL